MTSHFPPLGEPDTLSVVTETSRFVLFSGTDGAWEEGGVRVQMAPRRFSDGSRQLKISLQSELPICALELSWRGAFGPHTRFLGDAWERGYGDLEWRALVPERAMPWYFLAFDGQGTAGYGVQTGAGALAVWKTSASGISLRLDVKNGGAGVRLGERVLEVATLHFAQSATLSPFEFAGEFCRALCPQPRLPRTPVYGGNDWYYAYGDNSRASILRDADTIGELAPGGDNRPFMVIDDGWQICRTPWNGGPWHQAAPSFGEMSEVAAQMKTRGVRPGLWFRPLLSALNLPQSWHLGARNEAPPEGLPLDPSVPEVLELVKTDVRRFREWGFELVKHDFSTFDLFWKWGFDFGDDPASSEPATNGWHFADRSRTSAEITRDFYRALREAAGEEMLLLGCNTIGHLGAGFFEIQRTGDDTSGREWERTRKMGINTLAFRMAQHDTFFAVDADCVGLTNQIPWSLNRQWLELLARSGTPLFVSAAPDALGNEQKTALKRAFEHAAQSQSLAEPLDWLDTTCPATWRFGEEIRTFSWFDV